MFEVVVRLEECVAREEFDQDAANRPYITRKAPTHAEYDFWSTIVPRAYDIWMVFVLKSSTSKVNEAKLAVGQHFARACTLVICETFRHWRIADKKNVLGLQVCVYEIQVVQKGDAGK